MGALIGFVVVLAVLVLVIASRPASFRIERSATLAAPADVLFAQVNDFHKWVAWSPWEKLDPELKRTYSGAPAGVGAKYAWQGNPKAGKGNMTITESRPHERVALDLNFEKPFKAQNVSEFTFRPATGGTDVTWALSGKNNFVQKAFGMFVNMDTLLGKDFAQGLANLERAAQLQSGSHV